MARGEPVPTRSATDQELLRRFLSKRDEAAFRAVIDRYGPLVLSVCRRNTFCEPDAEDAFQATFVVLAQSAAKVRRRESLSAWLYGVAVRVSARARRASRRNTHKTLEEEVVQHNDPLDELLARHDGLVADEELSALPKNLRDPLVLRYLAGKSNQATAEELGITVAALEGRLKRGKSQLRARLLRRGVTLATVVAVLKTSRVAAESIPLELIDSAITLAAQPALASTSGATPPSTVSNLALEELKVMNALLVPKMAVSVVLAGAVLLTAGVHLANSEGSTGAAPQLVLQSDIQSDLNLNPSVEASTLVTTATPPTNGNNEGPLSRPQPNTTRVTDAFVPSVVDTKSRSVIERKIEHALTEKTANQVFDFTDTPLGDVLDALRSEYDIPIILDRSRLDDLGIDKDEPVSVNLPNGLKLQSALRHVLEPLELEAIIKDEALTVTTSDAAEAMLDTRIYPIAPVGVAADELKKLLTAGVRPDSWAEGASIKMLPSGDLLIRQSFAGHQEVTAVLKQLMVARQSSSKKSLLEPQANPGIPGLEDASVGSPQNQTNQTLGFASNPAPQEPASAVERWTKEDDATIKALKKKYSRLSHELKIRQHQLLDLSNDMGSVFTPQGALENDLDKQQIARLQQELLEVRRLDAISAGGRPVQGYLEELTAEIEQLSEAVQSRAATNLELDDQRDEIARLKAALDRIDQEIMKTELRYEISEQLQADSDKQRSATGKAGR